MKKILTVIPLFNKEETITRAVESALGQTVDCNILIIDDGSTDSSHSKLSSIKDKRVEVLSQSNHGVGYTRNVGIHHAVENEYDYVAFLDADDYWMPDHLSEFQKSIELFPKADIFANNYRQKFSEKKYSKTKFSNWKHDQPEMVKPFFKKNFLNSILTSSSFCMKTKGSEPVFYDESLTHTEDTDFLIRAGLSKKVVFNSNVTVVIDQTAANRSARIDLNNRVVMDFDKYEEKIEQHKGLKKFLDINRYSIAIGYRLENDIKNAAMYQHKIDTNNLTKKQKNLLDMSRRQLKALKRTQKILGNLGFRLRSGR